ncbi:MAG TPA: hypothetical protein DCL75_07400 [Ktedonobacter sp.]|jgi:hypothetical protein|nr:hypothetical protein [Ktedonobacter sp.]HAG98671.1 hypothetical protein [Ktedonobacter sp.]HCP74012.1 hypothetical protein [Ktedonobacter sp.]
MNHSLSRRVPRLREPAPLLQLLASVIIVFVLAFGADVLLQRALELFLAGIVEQDAFFYSAVRQQDAFAQNILALIKQLSFLALGIGFVVTLVFLFIPFSRRSRSTQGFQTGSKQLLNATLLSLRGIATVTFIFLVVTAIYELVLRIVGNQPPFFLLAALVTASMYVFILAYSLFDYAKERRAMVGSRSEKEEHTP